MAAYPGLKNRCLVVAGCVMALAGCAEHGLTASVQERGSVPPRATAAAQPARPAPPAAPQPEPVQPAIIPLVEERISSEPLPPPPPPRTPPVVAAKPPSEPPAAEGVPFLLDIPFNFDQAKLREDAVAMVEVNASRLQEKRGWSLLLEGHCDEVGTTEYNLVLGERRVQAVKHYLVRLGLPESAIEGISYGKERSLCTEHTPECWQKNRIVHFEAQ